MTVRSVLWSCLSLFALSWMPLAAACPEPPKDPTVLGDTTVRMRYALARLLKCGWSDAEPMVLSTLDDWAVDVDLPARANPRRFRELRGDRMSQIGFLVSALSPIDAVHYLADYGASDDPWFSPLRLAEHEHVVAAQRLEAAIPPLVHAFVARLGSPAQRPLSSYAALVLAVHEARSGNSARAEIDRLATLVDHAAQGDTSVVRSAEQLRAAFDAAPDSRTARPHWIVDRNGYVESCPPLSPGSAFDPDGVRAERRYAAGDLAGAIAILLRHEWDMTRELAGVMHSRRLRALLAERLPEALWAEAWNAAEASVVVDGPTPGFRLFDVELALPVGVLDQEADGRPAPLRRALRRDEALALMRESPLYQELFPSAPRH